MCSERAGSPGRLRAWIEARPPGWALRRLFQVMAVACIGGMVLDAAGAFPQIGPAPEGPGTRPEPTVIPRPSPGDHVRPYRPEIVPKDSPDRPANPSLPDGTPIDAPPFERMRFTFDTTAADVPYILAVGDIATGTAEQFRRFDADTGETARYLILISRGGVVGEALTMSARVRDRGLKTIIPREGFCFSACPLILAGGIERVVYPDAWVGVHRSRLHQISAGASPADAWEAGQASAADIMTHMEDMDVDPLVWRLAMETPFEDLYVLTEEQLRETGLATIVSANIRLR